MKKVVAAIAALFVLGGPAFAFQCPTLVKKIDEGLKTSTLSEADKAKVVELRNKGEEEHKTGKHAESVATLNEALKKLGM